MAERILAPGFIGTSPDDRYRYDVHLAHGASGFTWRISRNSDNMVFALKVTPVVQLTAEQRVRTETEVACLESVSHFACIRLFDKFRTDSWLFMVMEYCDAGDLHFQLEPLRAEVKRQERALNRLPSEWESPVSQCGMDEFRVRYIFLLLVLGLQYIHVQKKILHRDLKPANVLLTTNGLVKIGDFGLSNLYDTISGDVGRTLCGTPAYVAPELWQRRHYGRAADMWSLGCVVYECVAGFPPFPGTRMETLQHNVLALHPPPIQGNYSSGLKEVIGTLLQKDPAARPSTTTLLAHPYLQSTLSDLSGVLSSSGIAQRMVTQVMRDISRQLDNILRYRVDESVSFEGEVEKVKPPHEYHRRYVTLARGKLVIHRSKHAAIAWVEAGSLTTPVSANSNGGNGGNSGDDELSSPIQKDSDSSGDTGNGNGNGNGNCRSAIDVGKIDNVRVVNGDRLAINVGERGFFFFRTPQALLWEDALRRARGVPKWTNSPPTDAIL